MNVSQEIYNCKGCGTAFSGSYCNHCGQKRIGRFSLKYLWEALHADVFEVDRGLWLTVKDLTLRPGATIRSYLDGNTKKYYSPIKYMAVVAAVMYLLLSIESIFGTGQEIEMFSFEAWKEKFFGPGISPFSGASIVEIFMLPAILMKGSLLPYFLIVLPFTALCSTLVFKSLNYTELIITWMFLWAQVLILCVAALPILLAIVFVFDKAITAFIILMIANVIFFLGFFTATFRYLTNGKWITTFFKTILVMYAGYLSCGAVVWLVLNVVKVARG